jgi:hypothetical protein
MLEHEDSNVRQCALKLYITVVPYGLLYMSLYILQADYQPDDVRTSIFSSGMFCKLLSVLEDQDLDVRQCALNMYISLLQYC